MCVTVSLLLGAQHCWSQCSRCVSPELSWGEGSLPLTRWTCFSCCSPRSRWPFIAMRAHCKLMINSPSTKTPRDFFFQPVGPLPIVLHGVIYLQGLKGTTESLLRFNAEISETLKSLRWITVTTMYLHNTLKMLSSLTQLNIQDKVFTEIEFTPKYLVCFFFFSPQKNNMSQFAEKWHILLCPLQLSFTYLNCLCNIYIP